MACINIIKFTVERCEPRRCTAGGPIECCREGKYDWTVYMDDEALLRRELTARTALYVAEAVKQEQGGLKRYARQCLCLEHAGMLAEAASPEQGIPAQILVLLPGYTLVGSIRFDALHPLQKRIIVKRLQSGVNILFDRLHELNWHYDRASLALKRLEYCAEAREAG